MAMRYFVFSPGYQQNRTDMAVRQHTRRVIGGFFGEAVPSSLAENLARSVPGKCEPMSGDLKNTSICQYPVQCGGK